MATGVIRLSVEELRELLQLPADYEIRALHIAHPCGAPLEIWVGSETIPPITYDGGKTFSADPRSIRHSWQTRLDFEKTPWMQHQWQPESLSSEQQQER